MLLTAKTRMPQENVVSVGADDDERGKERVTKPKQQRYDKPES